MQVILTYLGAMIAKVFADKILSWIAFKVVLTFLFIIVVPLLLNNFLYDVIKIMMDFSAGQSTGAAALNGSMSFTGLCAWLLQCFRIPEALSILVSALVLRLTLSMIPFVRLVG